MATHDKILDTIVLAFVFTTKRDKTNISTQMLTSRVNNAKVMISQTSPAILLKKFKTCDDAIGSEQSYFGVNYVL